MDDLIRIWYVSSQRLCNFRCSYCVSINGYAKSNKFDWKRESDRENFEKIVRWIGSRPFPVGVRLATLGEPFASKDFLAQVAWLTRQEEVRFVELLTNGSLLKKRLSTLEADADLSKLSLWITHHHTEISVERLVENAVFAQEKYGCFVVVNGLIFPGNADEVAELRAAAESTGLRFNLDLGYEPDIRAGDLTEPWQLAPILPEEGGQDTVLRLGANPDMLSLNLTALSDVNGRPCSSGHNYIYIGIDGDVYPCSRYYVLKTKRLGNILDGDFELNLRKSRWAACVAKSGCCNKEDFLNLQFQSENRDRTAPSLGWVGN